MPSARVALFLATLMVAGVLTMSSCAGAPSLPTVPSQSSESRGAPVPAAAPSQPKASNLESTGSTAQDRMVIRSSYVQLIVSDVNAVIESISRLAEEMGGYVVSSESQEQGTERIGKASIRVPSDRLDDALKAVRGMAIRTGRETATARDVTEEFVDQEARLRALKATEEQYLQLMKTTRTTEDIIRVQQSLTQIREQIERTEGRVIYLRRNTEMAVINVDLATAGVARPLTGGAFDPADQASSALRGLMNALAALATVLIWIAVFAPIWLPAGLLIRWWQRREREKYLAGRPPTTPTPGAA